MMERSLLADFIEDLAEQDLGEPDGEQGEVARPTQSPVFGFKYESDTVVIYAGQIG